MHRLVQAIPFAQDLKGTRILRAAIGSDLCFHGVEKVAGRQLDNKKCNDRDKQEQRDHDQEPPQDEGQHGPVVL
ncbi:MAG: hypothetical protein HC802_18445 [Caldilineaceae bacterium]|nr:hypothetical protein [Caldilineaceae bacterium]